MQLTNILPVHRRPNRQVNLPEMLTNCLLAACQHREFKRLVGWKGMAVCPRGSQGWTFKMRSRTGVFGLATEHTGRDERGQHARLGLYYFPASDDSLLETMSLAANHAAVQPDYTDTLRQFTAKGDWAAPFRIGEISTSLAPEENGLILRFNALDKKLVIAKDGVMTADGKWVLMPGEAEEDFPAHDISTDFLLMLAAAVTNSVEAPPYRVGRNQTPDHGLVYDKNGERSLLDSEVCMMHDLLYWGDPEVLASMASLSLAQCTDTAGPESRASLPVPLDDALFWKTHDLGTLACEDAYAPAFDTRPGLIVLSGFLGAGKTTFLNQLLEYYAARDELVAIIQNEIGQTGVDGKLLEGDDSIVELDEGCVCCTLAGSLSKGIKQLRDRFNPKVIVLESTGLANPFNLLSELETLRPLVRLDSITTLVDAENGTRLLEDHDIARDQVAAADTILLNKCDLVDDQTRDRLRATLRELNGRAVLMETEHGSINPGYLYDTDPFESPAGLLPCLPGKRHHTHSNEGFTTRRFDLPSNIKRERLREVLDELPDTVFRVKGIVRLQDSAQPEVVQYVCGRHELSPLGDDFDQTGFLVAIGRDMELSMLEDLERRHA